MRKLFSVANKSVGSNKERLGLSLPKNKD